jgi:hypothetical protein
MFSTISLMFFTAFIVWMNTSQRISWTGKNVVFSYLAARSSYSRGLAGLMILVAGLLCVQLLGLGSGLFTAVVLLMTMGSIAVLFFPFDYFGIKTIAALYAACLLLEILTL